MLKCVAVCGSVLQCGILGVLQCVAVYCIVLHCVTVCYSVWQYVPAWHFECVAVCCNLEFKKGLTNLEKFYAVTHSLELKKGLTNLKKSYATTHSRAGYETLRCLFYLKY